MRIFSLISPFWSFSHASPKFHGMPSRFAYAHETNISMQIISRTRKPVPGIKMQTESNVLWKTWTIQMVLIFHYNVVTDF